MAGRNDIIQFATQPGYDLRELTVPVLSFTRVGLQVIELTLSFSGFLGFIAVTLATVNVVGGFMVTHRMLAMFKKR